MVQVKKGDFIELDFIGRLKENNKIFDLTDEKVARDNNIYNPEVRYKPIVICVGEKNVVPSLDKSLEGKETGKNYKIDVNLEEGFGKKDPKLIKLVSINSFRKQNINPVVGLQVSIDGIFGIIRSVSGGRVLVDFNHPLSGKDLVYEFKINRMIEDLKEKVMSFISLNLNLPVDLFEVNQQEDKIMIDLKELDKKLTVSVKEKIKDELKRVVPELKEIEFKTENKKEEGIK